MGKGRIVGGGSGGSYTVEVLHNRERIEDELAALTERLQALEQKLQDAQIALEYRELEVSEAAMWTDALIDQLEEEGALPPVDLDQLVSLHNSTRSAKGLPALQTSSALHAAAQGHANFLAANDLSGHSGAGGSTAPQRITAAGYPWQTTAGGRSAENVAVGIEPPEINALNGWMGSSGHRASILNPEYEHIGVGYACRPDGKFRHFWVACFGAAPGVSIPTGSPSPPSACLGGTDDTPERIRESLEELAKRSRDRDIAKLEVTQLTARQMEIEQRKAMLENIPASPTQQAWCADYTEDLAGEVATAEIPGEGTQALLVRPGYNNQSAHVPSRDGQLYWREGMTSAQAFFNAAILPGWQKFKPTYRVGTLQWVNKTTDRAGVMLDAAQSSAQSLGVNQDNYVEAPVVYMDCNADVFTAGDRVLVEFFGQDWGSPRVIGFESNPKPCTFWPIVQVALSARNDPWTGATKPDAGTDRVYLFEDCEGIGYIRSRGFATNTGDRPFRAYLNTSDGNHLRVLGGDETDTLVMPDNPVIWEYLQSADRAWEGDFKLKDGAGPWRELNGEVGTPVDLTPALAIREYSNIGTATWSVGGWFLPFGEDCPVLSETTEPVVMASGITAWKYYGASGGFTLINPSAETTVEFGPTDNPTEIMNWWILEGDLPEIKVVKEGGAEKIYQLTGMVKQQVETGLPMQAWFMIFEAPED